HNSAKICHRYSHFNSKVLFSSMRYITSRMPIPQTEIRLTRSLARDEAYEKIRDWIIDGTLRPGELLRDQEIAQSLGVSRTPMREALRRLEDEGFVETALNRWTRVAPL